MLLNKSKQLTRKQYCQLNKSLSASMKFILDGSQHVEFDHDQSPNHNFNTSNYTTSKTDVEILNNCPTTDIEIINNDRIISDSYSQESSFYQINTNVVNLNCKSQENC